MRLGNWAKNCCVRGTQNRQPALGGQVTPVDFSSALWSSLLGRRQPQTGPASEVKRECINTRSLLPRSGRSGSLSRLVEVDLPQPGYRTRIGVIPKMRPITSRHPRDAERMEIAERSQWQAGRAASILVGRELSRLPMVALLSHRAAPRLLRFIRQIGEAHRLHQYLRYSLYLLQCIDLVLLAVSLPFHGCDRHARLLSDLFCLTFRDQVTRRDYPPLSNLEGLPLIPTTGDEGHHGLVQEPGAVQMKGARDQIHRLRADQESILLDSRKPRT